MFATDHFSDQMRRIVNNIIFLLLKGKNELSEKLKLLLPATPRDNRNVIEEKPLKSFHRQLTFFFWCQ